MDEESSLKRLRSDRTASTAHEPTVRRRGWVAVDFFTHSYRISGTVDVRRISLADQLNDRTSSYLLMEDTYVSPIDRPGDITASYAQAALRKENITMAVLTNKDITEVDRSCTEIHCRLPEVGSTDRIQCIGYHLLIIRRCAENVSIPVCAQYHDTPGPIGKYRSDCSTMGGTMEQWNGRGTHNL